MISTIHFIYYLNNYYTTI